MSNQTAQFNGEVGNIESNVNKVDTFSEDITEEAAKQKYPNIKCLMNLIDKVFPIGMILSFDTDINPNELYGGTWERIKGAVIWGIDDGETAGATGGNKSHSHTLGDAFAEFYAHSGNGGGFSYAEVSGVKRWNTTHNVAGNNAIENVVAATYGTVIGGATDTESNMMPYYGAYVWRRTA